MVTGFPTPPIAESGEVRVAGYRRVPLVAFYSRAIATNQPVNEAWPDALNALPNCAKVMKKMSADIGRIVESFQGSKPG
ncbi:MULTISPECIES: hypothetical protein [unclassified Caballeronia]|uniref:hypothetical protein n=1 Tax=unclassified Caballeronia TaxID=2646786 RepID=UPI00117D6F63|nr:MULTISPECIES: hypothetical protein [unclassified Caballeronia]